MYGKIYEFVILNQDRVCFSKLRLGVKPPIEFSPVRHKTIFSKLPDFEGGLTLMPRYENQPPNHQGLPAKDAPSFIFVPKS